MPLVAVIVHRVTVQCAVTTRLAISVSHVPTRIVVLVGVKHRFVLHLIAPTLKNVKPHV
jgi:hypothetical protein